MKKILGSISAVLALVFIFSSCSLNNSSAIPQVGYFLVASLSPDAPHLNISINNSTFDTGLAFGNYTPYYNANGGTYNFVVFSSGSATPVINNNVNIEVNKAYSYFVIDSFSKAKAAVVEDAFQPPSGDSIYIRFFQFSPNISQPINVVDSTGTLFSGRTFNDQVSNPLFANFIELKAGSRTLQIKQFDGTVLASQVVTLDGGKVYTLVGRGFYGGTGDQALGIGELINYPQQ
jgi:hypothetical protein